MSGFAKMNQLGRFSAGNFWLRNLYARSIQQPALRPDVYFSSGALFQRRISRGLCGRPSHRLRPLKRSGVLRHHGFLCYRSFGRQAQPPVNPAKAETSLSFSQRMRKLSREYGWSALGVYLFLSVLDFPLCFLAVRTLGAEKIGYWEHLAVEWFRKVLPWPLPQWRKSESSADEQPGSQEGVDGGWTLKEAEKKNDKAGNASLWTELALAYAVHKSFIFIRVPLTAAITPKVVRVLRRWGWDLGKRKLKIPKPPKDV